MKTMSTTMTLLALTLSLGCGSDPAASGDDDDSTDPSVTNGDDDDDDDDNTGGTDAPDWSGNWTVQIEWSVTCELPFQDPIDNSGSDGWALALSGQAGNLTALVNGNDWFTLTGSGDEEGVRLCGKFPMYDTKDDEAVSNNANSICITGDFVVDEGEVWGSAEGSFEGSFGEDCDLNTSDVVLTH